jgi:hypothetical protein
MSAPKFSWRVTGLLALALLGSCEFGPLGPSDETIRTSLLEEFKNTPKPLTNVTEIERGDPVQATRSLGLDRPTRLFPVRVRVSDQSGASYPMSYYFYQTEGKEWRHLVNRQPATQ